MNAIDIVRAAIPSAGEELAEHILWGRTHFPFAPVDAKMLYRAASRFRRAHEHNVRMCDFCDRPAVAKQALCERCNAAMEAARA